MAACMLQHALPACMSTCSTSLQASIPHAPSQVVLRSSAELCDNQVLMQGGRLQLPAGRTACVMLEALHLCLPPAWPALQCNVGYHHGDLKMS